METNELHRGRLIDHVQLVVRDLAASHAFYAAVFQALKVPMGGANEEVFLGRRAVRFHGQQRGRARPATGRVHLAFQAQSRDMVHAFYEAALAHGGQDNGAPGERMITPATTPRSCLDPDGNNIEAVFHGDAKRSVALGQGHVLTTNRQAQRRWPGPAHTPRQFLCTSGLATTSAMRPS